MSSGERVNSRVRPASSARLEARSESPFAVRAQLQRREQPRRAQLRRCSLAILEDPRGESHFPASTLQGNDRRTLRDTHRKARKTRNIGAPPGPPSLRELPGEWPQVLDVRQRLQPSRERAPQVRG